MRLPDLRQSEPPHPLIEKVKSKERLTPADTLREHRDTAKKHVEKGTKEKKKELVDKIKEYRLHHAATALETHEHETLNELQTEAEKELGVVPAEPPGEVTDIAEKIPEDKKTILDKAKEFFTTTGFGALMKAWISIQRLVLPWLPGHDAAAKKQKLDELDKTYRSLFGPHETQQIIAGMLKDSPLSIEKGNRDGVGYAVLRAEYERNLDKKLKQENPDKKPDLEEAIRAAYKFEENFLPEQVKEYLKKYVGSFETGKRYQTTLLGIAKNEKPKEISAP